MKELMYPFDVDMLMAKRRSLKKIFLKQDGLIEKKIAILGGSTTNDIKNMLELFLLNNGINASFYESEYNKYYEDALFTNRELEEFAPDIIYIYTTNRNLISLPKVTDTSQRVDELLEAELTKYQEIWDALWKRFHCPIIQNNFELPLYRLLGNYDAIDIHGSVNFVMRLNLEFCKCIEKRDCLYLCDLNYISSDFGLKDWYDEVSWYMYKYAFNLSAIPHVAHNVSNIIKSILGKNKKGMILDLDNTLWGGVIGEDGVNSIILNQEEPEGQAYIDFQKYIKGHKELGVLLSIASKNDLANAEAGLAHSESILSKEDFVEIMANWDSKDLNVLKIASNLNVMPDSLVFIDDNPAERLIVEQNVSGVCAPEIGKITDYIHNLDRNGFFEVTNITEEDLERNDMYFQNSQRVKAEQKYRDYGDYLKALNMKAVIKEFDEACLARITQLTNKSNQFNLTTRRYTKEELEKISASTEYITLYGNLVDRFGNNGIVSVIIGHIVENICYIELWIMSCRVLKRDMECAMMDKLTEKCLEYNISKIKGMYIPTNKNSIVKDFYRERGFKCISNNQDGSSEWIIELSKGYMKQNKYILIEECFYES